MAKKTTDQASVLEAMVIAMERALTDQAQQGETAACEQIFAQLRRPGGFRRRITAWRRERGDDDTGDGSSGMGAGQGLRPPRRRR